MTQKLKKISLYGLLMAMFIVGLLVNVKKADAVSKFDQNDILIYTQMDESGGGQTDYYNARYFNCNSVSQSQTEGKFNYSIGIYENQGKASDNQACDYSVNLAYDIADNPSMAFSMWFKATSSPTTWSTLIASNEIGETTFYGSQFAVLITNTGYIHFRYMTNTSNEARWTSDDPITFGTDWRNLIVRYLATDIDSAFNLYIDGEVLSGTWNGYGDEPLEHTSGTMGYRLAKSYVSGNGYGFKGYIDEVIIFNRWITQDEIDFLQISQPPDEPVPFADDYIQYMKDLNSYINYDSHDFIDDDDIKTRYIEVDYDFQGLNFGLIYNVWANNDYNVWIGTSTTDSSYTQHDYRSIENASSPILDEGYYQFTSIPIASTTPTIYVLAYLYDENGLYVDQEKFKIVTDKNDIINQIIASSTPDWICVYDISTACDTVSTSTGSTLSDMRYAMECSLRKVFYWSFTPNTETCTELSEQITEFKTDFPFNIYYNIKNQIEISQDTASSTVAIPFLPTTQYLNIEGEFFDTGMMQDTWGDMWTRIYFSVQLIIYGLGTMYFIYRIIKFKNNAN